MEIILASVESSLNCLPDGTIISQLSSPTYSSLFLTYVEFVYKANRLFSPLGATRLTRFLQATRSSVSLHISFSPAVYIVLPLCSSWSFPLNFTLWDGVCHGCLHSRHTSNPSQLSVNNLQQRVIRRNVLCNSPVYCHVGHMRGVIRVSLSPSNFPFRCLHEISWLGVNSSRYLFQSLTAVASTPRYLHTFCHCSPGLFSTQIRKLFDKLYLISHWCIVL